MAFEESSFSAETFSGTVRLFPLPNLVLFPHVLQPLHVFEQRYRDLLSEAIAEDGLIAMAMLAPGWEKDYEGRPPLYPVACLGQVASYHRLKEGSYNVLLLGVQRVRLLDELAPRKSFREARVELCEDRYPSDDSLRPALQQKLHKAILRTLPMIPQAREQLDQLLASDMPLGVLADLISYLLDIEFQEKTVLLEELDVFRRVDLLLEHLVRTVKRCRGGSCPKGSFPPGFSSN
jgi:Lon protease-like protein